MEHAEARQDEDRGPARNVQEYGQGLFVPPPETQDAAVGTLLALGI